MLYIQADQTGTCFVCTLLYTNDWSPEAQPNISSDVACLNCIAVKRQKWPLCSARGCTTCCWCSCLLSTLQHSSLMVSIWGVLIQCLYYEMIELKFETTFSHYLK